MQHHVNKYKANESVQLQFVFSETLLDVTFHLVLINTLLILKIGIVYFLGKLLDHFFH